MAICKVETMAVTYYKYVIYIYIYMQDIADSFYKYKANIKLISC